MTISKIFVYFCLSFVFGIAVSSFSKTSQFLMLGVLILGLFLISVPPSLKLKKRAGFVIIGFCLLFFVLGIWRHADIQLNIPQIQKQDAVFVGTVAGEPDIRENHTKLTLIEVKPQSIKGKVLVTTSKYPEYQYGDKLAIDGKLETPQVFEDFNYKDYLIKDGIYSVMYFPKIEYLGKNEGGFASIIYSKVLQFKAKLRESVYRNLSPPQSSILGAVILGDKSRLSDDLKEKLSKAGVRHITAVSGMHITIFSVLLMQILIGLGLWKKQAFYLTLAFLILFIIMVGLPASAVRAGLMGGIFLLAKHLGRSSSGFRPIVFAGTAMLAANPLLLKLDVGFQLSFLAVMGIICLMPIFEKWVKFKILAMTLSAQVFTLPILIYNFGYFSLIAPLTNILIVPLLPYIMVLGFLSGLAGIVWQSLGWVLSWPAWLLLTYLTKIVDWFSQIPFAIYTLEISWIWLIVAYLILGGLVWKLNQNKN